MQSIKCAFVASVKDAEIKTTKGGKDYLSLDAIGGVDDETRFWIATFSGIDDLFEKIKPDTKVYVEGTEKIRLDSRNGEPYLAVSATLIVPMFEIEARPKPRAGAAKREKAMEREADILADGRAAPAQAEKTYDHDFNDPLPF
jgi:hypothetical protein